MTSNFIYLENQTNKVFNYDQNKHLIDLLQFRPWIENNLEFSFARSYVIDNDWSFAGGLDLYYLDRINYKKFFNEKKHNNNIRIEARLTKRFKNIYISFGGFKTKTICLELNHYITTNLVLNHLQNHIVKFI